MLLTTAAALGGVAAAAQTAEPESAAADTEANGADGASTAAAMFPPGYEVFDADTGQYVLPPLPYPYDALEPHIDAQTMRLHHDAHHAGYVRGLNTALAKLADARQSGDFDLVQYWTNKVSFNGGGHTLHSMFWATMAPSGHGGGGQPTGPLADAIARSFGSFDSFKTQFSRAAATVEGGGWGLLGLKTFSGDLVVLQAENQQKLTTWDFIPLLGVDVWEHAYYLKYQNKRAEYIDNWWQVVSWPAVAQRYAAAVRHSAGHQTPM
jgi:Fe-Mn family superoxide dismutase